MRDDSPAPLSITLKYHKVSARIGPHENKEVTVEGPGAGAVSFSTNHVELEKCRLLGIQAIDEVIFLIISRIITSASRILIPYHLLIGDFFNECSQWNHKC